MYSTETPGREIIDQAHAALPAEEAEAALAFGRTLTLKQALELAGES